MLHGVVHQFGVVAQTHFLQNTRAIGADSLDAQGKLTSDFADDFTGGNQSQDLKFVAYGHGYIEDNNVPILLPDEIERFLRVAGFSKGRPLELIGEDLLEAVTHYGVIVG